jgi:hypothetical protein
VITHAKEALSEVNTEQSKFDSLAFGWTVENTLDAFTDQHCYEVLVTSSLLIQQCGDYGFYVSWISAPPKKLCTSCIYTNRKYAMVSVAKAMSTYAIKPLKKYIARLPTIAGMSTVFSLMVSSEIWDSPHKHSPGTTRGNLVPCRGTRSDDLERGRISTHFPFVGTWISLWRAVGRLCQNMVILDKNVAERQFFRSPSWKSLYGNDMSSLSSFES